MNRLSPAYTLKLINESLISPIKSIVDVGVQTKTSCLMEVFPHAHHYLFEPVTIYHSSIDTNYQNKGISYSLIKKAVSDESGVMFQHLIQTDPAHGVTHSQLLDSRDPGKFGDSLHSIVETEVISLDEWGSGLPLSEPYLIKIDVDGLEDRIIQGGKKLLASADVVMVEAALEKLSMRVAAIERLGFKLFDLVGNGYYCNQLQQVDLIFISSRLSVENLNFQPWKKHGGAILWEEWMQYE